MSISSILLTEGLSQVFHVGGYYAPKGSLLGRIHHGYMAMSPAKRFMLMTSQDIVEGYITSDKSNDAFNTVKSIALFGGFSSVIGMVTDNLVHHHGQEIKRQFWKNGKMAEGKDIARYLHVGGKQELRKQIRKFNRLPTGGKIGRIGMAGAYLGMAMSGKKHLAGTLTDAAIGAGVAIGVGAIGAHIIEKHGKSIKKFIKGSRGINLGREFDKAKAQVIGTKKAIEEAMPKVKNGGILSDAEKVKVIKNAEKSVNILKHGARIGIAAIGVGMLIDIGNGLHHNHKVKDEKAKQEQKAKDQEVKDKQDMRQMFGYNYVDFGDIVKDMWNQRIGHYKLGNAKFN
jgi:hypothetical protein